jgi:alpha-L-fucosidase 2
VTGLNEGSFRKLREVSPINHVHQQTPPFLLIHGTQDELVAYSQSVKMLEKLKGAGVPCELFTVEGAGHGVGGWEKDPKFQEYKTKMVTWLKQVLK